MKWERKFWIVTVTLSILISCRAFNFGTQQTSFPSPIPESQPSATVTAEVTVFDSPSAMSTLQPPSTLQTNPKPTVTFAKPMPNDTATPLPTVTQTTVLTGTPREGEPVVSYETVLTIQTYGYKGAFLPTNPEDDIYPYPRIDPEKVTSAQPKEYKAIVLENDYMALYIIPELGGRIYRWVDKITGRRLLYENPVIKPTQWGYRGWWLAAGGIEWAFPVEEHGLNEWRPWTYITTNTGNIAFVSVSDTEDRTGLEVGVTILIDRNSTILMLQPWVSNSTISAKEYQFWINAMLAFNENKMSKNTEFILPASQVLVHSTGDKRFPGEWQWMPWPVYNGIQVSHYDTWQEWLGFFVPHVSAGFTAVYDRDVGQGVIRIFRPGWPSGTKIFGPGTLPSWLWTDDDSNYVELWSGITATFADYRVLIAGESMGWVEYWYPVHDIGGINTANTHGALHLAIEGNRLEIGAAVTSAEASSLILWQDQLPIHTWSLSLDPGQTLKTTWAISGSTSLGLSMMDSDGNVMIQTGHIK